MPKTNWRRISPIGTKKNHNDYGGEALTTSVQDSIKSGLLAGGCLPAKQDNNPSEYADRRYRYFDRSTMRFTAKYAKYSSDYFDCMAQGLDPEDRFAWEYVRIRLANVVRPSSAIQRNFDDYKMLMIDSDEIEYVPVGAKFVVAGNTWLMLNPNNMTGADGAGIVRRCNAVWNHLDFYGNVVSEPIIADTLRMDANDSDAQAQVQVAKGYFNLYAQYNDATRQLNTNSRMILGSGCYRITGYSDFQTEFTGDYDSIRILEFSARYEEPNFDIDDMANHVAEGKLFRWDVDVTGIPNVGVGQSVQFLAHSIRNGESADGVEAHPVTYVWKSSDESVAVVSEDGVVTGVSAGDCKITAKVQENESLACGAFNISVSEPVSGSAVRFTSAVPNKIKSYTKEAVSAAYFVDGVETDGVVEFSIAGGKPGAATLTRIDGKSVWLECWNGCVEPITLTASCNGEQVSAAIKLENI